MKSGLSPRLRVIVDDLEIDASEHRLAESPSADTDDPELIDLSDLPFVTIDNEGSRDLDQALHIEPDGEGWLVRYAIADAAHFVRPGTALWAQAVARGASYYLPGFAIPMLPRLLSEDVISLNENVLRRAVVFTSRIARDGEAIETRIERARICSVARLTYAGVQGWYDSGLPSRPWGDSVGLLKEVGEARARRARSRGVVEFDRSEVEITVTEDDRFVFSARQRLDAERWNEQLSLLCNTEGARLLYAAEAYDEDLASVYRVHLPPLPRRLEELQRVLDRVAEHHGLGAQWRWDGVEPLADYLRELPKTPWRVRRAVELQIRYTNRASEYSDRVGPHHALAVDQYARFSAPMREIVGVFTHKEALESLGFAHDPDPESGRVLREQVIASGNASRMQQKRIDSAVKLLAIADLLDSDLARDPAERPWRAGTVIGIRPKRAYVELDDPSCDVKVYGDASQDLALGDAVELRVSGFDGRYQFATRFRDE